MKKILVILLTGSLLFTNSAFAGRFGGGRNSGMQRSVSPSSTNSGYSQSPQSPMGQPQQQRQGMGAGTAALLGAAAGATGGYLLGKNSNNTSNASGTVTSEARSSIPWGTIIILIAILALGLMFFRKKTHPGLSANNPLNNFNSNNQNSFNMPKINLTPNKNQPKVQIVKAGAVNAPSPEQFDKMPDGIETMYFLRQVKGMFLHIQSMNNGENLSEIQKYMTAQLFEDTKNDVATNDAIADFINLDCQLLECEATPASQTDDGQPVEAKLVASVKFFGNVSETPAEPPKPFSEIWNFVKSISTNNKWLVAGIQQEALSS